MTPVLRRGTSRVAPEAADLILSAIPSLEFVLGDRATAVRAIESCYRAERTELAYRFSLLAEVDHELSGIAIAFPGRLHGALKLGTGVVMARAAGARHVAELAQRARVINRLLPNVDPHYLYVPTLSVAHDRRRQGIATALMDRVITGADRLGLGVALDTAMGDEPARALYEKLGFRVISVHETSEDEKKMLPISGLVRLERPAGL
ncbi:MAG: GNAT family N-acetyltransferase [Actinomycetota bacterium]